MQIGEIHKSKETDTYIIIDSFASRMGNLDNTLIIFNLFLNINDDWLLSPLRIQCGTEQEIKDNYSLFTTADQIKGFDSWKEFFNEMIK